MTEADLSQLRRTLARLVGIDPECWQADRLCKAVKYVAPKLLKVLESGHGEVCIPIRKHEPLPFVRTTLEERADGEPPIDSSTQAGA